MKIAQSASTFFPRNDSRGSRLGVDSMSPDERVFREHVTSTRFREGVERGRWRIVGEIAWPVVLVAVAAAPRDGAPPEHAVRFDLTGYPETAPTATPWNPAAGGVLEQELRPKGERVGRVFRIDWENGKALYAPFDRVALNSHPNWKTQYPRQAWNSTRDLTWLLQILHEMLNNDDYTGI